MLCLWSDNNAAEKKVKTFFLGMPEPGAARLTPHCQIFWPNFSGRYQPLPISAAAAFIAAPRSSQTLHKPPPLSNISEMLPDSSSCRLVYSAAAFLVSAFYLNQGAAPAIVGGCHSNLPAGQEMKLPAFYGATRWDHRDDRSRWRCVLTEWLIFPSADVATASCLIVGN